MGWVLHVVVEIVETTCVCVWMHREGMIRSTRVGGNKWEINGKSFESNELLVEFQNTLAAVL